MIENKIPYSILLEPKSLKFICESEFYLRNTWGLLKRWAHTQSLIQWILSGPQESVSLRTLFPLPHVIHADSGYH